MSDSSHSALPSPEDWEWFKRTLETAEAMPDADLPPGGRTAWIVEQTRLHRPGLIAFVDRHAAQMLENETRAMSRPSHRPLDDHHSQSRLFDTGDLVGGRYTVTRFLGAGGMGEVYQVDDAGLPGRSVALKTIRGDLAGSKDADSRFEREVRAALAVAHSNVCRIYDVGRHRTGGTERLFLTMELLTGTLLSDRVRPMKAWKTDTAAREPDRELDADRISTITAVAIDQPESKIPEAEALTIIRQLAAGLAAIHACSIVHRDFKPANVMLVPDEADGLLAKGSVRAVIMDFGLARVLDFELDRGVTQTGLNPGTPAYMAPEQLTGSGPSTFASDVYSLGVTMHEMLTGRRYNLNGSFKALQRSGVSLWLRDVVIGCLQADTTKRYRNAGEVAAALDERTRRHFRPQVWAVVASVLVLTSAGTGVWWWKQPAPPPAAAVRAYQQGLEDLHSAAPFLASTRFQEALRIQPQYAAASARLAQAWIDMRAVGRARDAILEVDNADTLGNLDEPTRRLCEAVRLTVLGEHAKAIPLFEALAAKARDEDRTNAQMDLAWELDRATQGARAAKIWQSLAATSPYAALRAATGPASAVAKRLDQALAGFERAHNMEGETQVMYQRALALPASRGEEAKKLLLTVAERAHMSHDVYQEASAHLQAAYIFITNNEIPEGERHASLAMQIARSGLVEMTFARGLRALGNAAMVKGDQTSAEQYYQDSLRLARENRDPSAVAGSQQLIADLHIRTGRAEAGEKEALEAYDYYSRAGDLGLAILTANTLTYARRELGKFELAEESLGLARKDYGSQKEPDPSKLGEIETSNAQIERYRGRYPAAAEHMRKAVELSISSNVRLLIPYNWRLLADNLGLAGDQAGSRAALASVIGENHRIDVAVRRALNDSYFAPEHISSAAIESLLAKVTNQSDRTELEIVLLEQALLHHEVKAAAQRLDGPLKTPHPYLTRDTWLRFRLARAQGLTAVGRKQEAVAALGDLKDFSSHAILAWRAPLVMAHATEGSRAAAYKAAATHAFQAFRSGYGEANAQKFLDNRHDLTAEWKEIEPIK